MNRKRGFTLIELLISIAIIAILTAIGIVSYNSVSKRSRDAKRMGDLEQLRSGLEMYRSDFGHYPAVNTTGFDNASLLDTTLVMGGYLPAIPADPQASQYPYKFVVTDFDNFTQYYYGYCLAARIETTAPPPNCGAVMLPTGYNYGIRQP